MAELVVGRVLGQLPVVDAATGRDVNPGGTCVLDPEHTNIPAIVAGGHWRPLTDAEQAEEQGTAEPSEEG